MKKLIIVGAGGFGREVAEWALGCQAFRREWEIAGFLDDNPDALKAYPGCGLPIIGSVREYEPRNDELFVIGIGQPVLRRRMRELLEGKDARFTRLVHSSCVVGNRVQLEPGVILCPRVVLTCDIHIKANTAFNISCAVGHDVVVGRDCQISSFCDLTGFVQLGDEVLMGSRATIIPGKRIGNQSIVGAGSVVISDVPSHVTVFGNPAKLLSKHRNLS